MKVFITAILLSTILNNFLEAQWIQTNCPFGGGIYSIAVRGNDIFAGTWDSGIYRSADNGLNWEAINSGLTYYMNVKSLTVKTNKLGGNDILAGTFGGVYRFTDEGTSWEAISNNDYGLPFVKQVNSIAIKDSNIFAATTYDGIFLSTDNGSSWKAVNNGLTSSYVGSIVINGNNIFATTTDKIFLSTNDGLNWTETNNGLPDEGRNIYTLTINENKIYVSVSGNEIVDGDRTSFSAIYLSTDNGMNWNTQAKGWNVPACINSFIFIGDNIFAGTGWASWGDGIFISPNNGLNWKKVNLGFPEQIAVYSLFIKQDTIWAGTNKGVWYRPLSEMITKINLPIVVDNSEWFPPVRSQQVLPNCTHFSLIYYLKSSIWNREFNRNPLLETNQFNHNFIWNQDGEALACEIAGLFSINQGCATVADFPINEQTSEILPSLPVREKAMSYKTKRLHIIEVRGGEEMDSLLIADQLMELKDSLSRGSCFAIYLPLFKYWWDIESNNNIYNCYKGISIDSVLFGHYVCVVGYDDTIKTAQGRGAFKVINSNEDIADGKFYLDYNWLFYLKHYFPCFFLEEDFFYHPELLLNINLISSIPGDERSKIIFTDTVFVNNNGKRIDVNDPYYTYYANFLKLVKINGEIVPSILDNITNNNLLFLPPVSSDGNYQILSDLTKYVNSENFQSMELLVCDPVSVIYFGIIPDANGNYTGEVSNIYSYTRQPHSKVEEAYIKLLETDKSISGKVTELPDTTIYCYDFYSSLLTQLVNPPVNNYVLVTQSISMFKRKLITFNIADTVTVNINDVVTIPSNYCLRQNYPNPFNPTTTISYSIPYKEFVTLKIYDVLGKEISTLVNEEKTAGNFEVSFNANGISSGIYFYKISAGSFTDTKKFILIK